MGSDSTLTHSTYIDTHTHEKKFLLKLYYYKLTRFLTISLLGTSPLCSSLSASRTRIISFAHDFILFSLSLSLFRSFIRSPFFKCVCSFQSVSCTNKRPYSAYCSINEYRHTAQLNYPVRKTFPPMSTLCSKWISCDAKNEIPIDSHLELVFSGAFFLPTRHFFLSFAPIRMKWMQTVHNGNGNVR